MESQYIAPDVKRFGNLSQVTGVIDPSAKSDVDERSGETGEGSFNITPVE
jgi:hypothetical protein